MLLYRNTLTACFELHTLPQNGVFLKPITPVSKDNDKKK